MQKRTVAGPSAMRRQDPLPPLAHLLLMTGRQIGGPRSAGTRRYVRLASWGHSSANSTHGGPTPTRTGTPVCRRSYRRRPNVDLVLARQTHLINHQPPAKPLRTPHGRAVWSPAAHSERLTACAQRRGGRRLRRGRVVAAVLPEAAGGESRAVIAAVAARHRRLQATQRHSPTPTTAPTAPTCRARSRPEPIHGRAQLSTDRLTSATSVPMARR